jgi:hypothetical protein
MSTALQVLSPLMRVSPAYGEVVMGVFALIAYQVHFQQRSCVTDDAVVDARKP